MVHPKMAAFLRRERQQAGAGEAPAMPAKKQTEKASAPKGEGYKRKNKED